MTQKDKHAQVRPGMNAHTAELVAEKQEEQREKSAQQHYPVEDKRKEARQEHINGSTPRRDQ